MVTHRRILNPPSTLPQAVSFLERVLASPSCRIVRPGPDFVSLLTAASLAAGARGNLVFDAQIVALCREHRDLDDPHQRQGLPAFREPAGAAVGGNVTSQHHDVDASRLPGRAERLWGDMESARRCRLLAGLSWGDRAGNVPLRRAGPRVTLQLRRRQTGCRPMMGHGGTGAMDERSTTLNGLLSRSPVGARRVTWRVAAGLVVSVATGCQPDGGTTSASSGTCATPRHDRWAVRKVLSVANGWRGRLGRHLRRYRSQDGLQRWC